MKSISPKGWCSKCRRGRLRSRGDAVVLDFRRAISEAPNMFELYEGSKNMQYYFRLAERMIAHRQGEFQ